MKQNIFYSTTVSIIKAISINIALQIPIINIFIYLISLSRYILKGSYFLLKAWISILHIYPNQKIRNYCHYKTVKRKTEYQDFELCNDVWFVKIK